MKAGFSLGEKKVTLSNQVSISYKADFFLGPSNANLFSGSFSTPALCTEAKALVPVQTNAPYVNDKNGLISERSIADLYFSGIAQDVYKWRGMGQNGAVKDLLVPRKFMPKAFLYNNSAPPNDRGYLPTENYATLATSTHEHESKIGYPWVSCVAGYRFSPFFKAYLQAKWSFAPAKEEEYKGVNFIADPSILKDKDYKTAGGATRTVSALALVPFKHSDNKIARDFKVYLSTQEKSSFSMGFSLQPRSDRFSVDLLLGMQQTDVNISLSEGSFAYPMVTTSYQPTFAGVQESALWISTVPVKFKESLWPFLFGFACSFKLKKAYCQIGCEYYTVDSNVNITMPVVEKNDDPAEIAKKTHTYNIPYFHKPTRLRELRDAQEFHMGAPEKVEALVAANVKIKALSFFFTLGWTF